MLTTTILATYTVSLTRVINGKVFIVTVPSATAFNVVFTIGIVLAAVVIALSLAIDNKGFKNGNNTKKTD